jgi:hypothetical protein
MSDIEASVARMHVSHGHDSDEDDPVEEFALSRSATKGPSKRLFCCSFASVLNELSVALDAVVGIMDNSEVTVNCPQGKYITAGELRDLVAGLIGLDEAHKDLFAIWVISGALRLLSPRPFFP